MLSENANFTISYEKVENAMFSCTHFYAKTCKIHKSAENITFVYKVIFALSFFQPKNVEICLNLNLHNCS